MIYRFTISLLFFSLLLVNATTFASEAPQFSGIVDSHNKVREKFSQQPLSWSNALAQYAQQWVDYLATHQNCLMIHRPEHISQFQQQHGENLFWASAEKRGDESHKMQVFSPQEVVNAWAEEEQYYDYQSNQCQPGEQCGHFTQMVWHESREVGCAKAVCPDKSQIWACNYHPRGNYIGEWPY